MANRNSSGKKSHPPRLRRAESFLGIHFDKHMGRDCTRVGENVSRRMVERIIDLVRPDYIQIDCKGHSGITSYPTKLGNAAPGFVRDPLRIFRQVTAERGVALYMHYSGVFEREAVRKHPSWAEVGPDGKRSKANTSVFGPYVDKLMIPQLRELAGDYGVDGVWVDGECWACCQDYGKKVLARFRRETGIRTVPKKPGDKGFREFSELCREGFREYLRHYVDELHRTHPDFQLCSNWAFSSFMPEPVSANVDFLSGDYSLQNSVNAARWEGRCLAGQGLAWDLMAWGFGGKFGDRGSQSTKTAVQMKQEAAQVVAMGGGFQAYYKQKQDASINEWTMEVMAQVAEFCRARQQTCHQAEMAPQVGLIYPGKSFYRKTARVFSPWDGEAVDTNGLLRCLLENQLPVEIVMEHHLDGRMDDYPLLVLGEWDWLEPKFKKQLLAYVEGGGKLLLVGPAAARLFRKQLKTKLLGKPKREIRWVDCDGRMATIGDRVQHVAVQRGAKVFGKLYAQNDRKGDTVPAASIAPCGKGRIAAVYFPVGERYCKARTELVRTFLGDLVRELFPRPMVDVGGSHDVDVVLTRKDGRLNVNLLNTAGPHANEKVATFEEVPAIGPLDVIIRPGRKPKNVMLQPAGRKLRHEYKRGEVRCRIPRLELHEIITVE